MKPVPWQPRDTPYPSARRDDTVRAYESERHGEVKVADPYAWLEDDTAETNAFVEAQQAFTEKYLSQDEDNRAIFRDTLRELFNYARFSAPSLKGDRYYYHSYNSGLQAQSAIYRVKKGSEHAPEDDGPGGELFFDPNKLSSDGTTALSSTAFSKSGKYYAYGLSQSGSDWTTIYVRETRSPHRPDMPVGTDEGRLSDKVEFVKFSSITWLHDDSGFLYARYPDPSNLDPDRAQKDANADHTLYLHKLGTPQSKDIFIIRGDEAKPSQHMYGGRYLELTTSRDTGRSNLLWVADLQKPLSDHIEWTKIVDVWGDEWFTLANDGPLQYLATTKDAPRRKIVTFDMSKPEQGFKPLIDEDAQGGVLKSIHIANDDALVLVYTRDVKDEMHIYDLRTGKHRERVGGDIVGTIGGISGKREHDEFFFSVSGFVNPGQVFRYEFKKPDGQRLSLYRSTNVKGIDPSEYKTEQHFYVSKDGTRIPMFVTTPKDATPKGSAPTILYGYGGFSVDILPAYSPSWMTWLKLTGGAVAVPNIRGGGEYGEAWHQAGMLDRKQNVLDDFQAAARFLREKQISGKIAISGGSNGGLLVAACVNQAPELFDAAAADVGVMDMLRFHKFTIGAAWCADYGNADKPHDFDVLYAYSPVHNVDGSKTYPPTILLTGQNDDRVVPLHSFKLVAEMQHTLADNPNPLMLRVDLKSGHGAGKSTEKRIIEAADRWSFVAQSLGIRFSRPARGS